jgi:hypothetical protein
MQMTSTNRQAPAEATPERPPSTWLVLIAWITLFEVGLLMRLGRLKTVQHTLKRRALYHGSGCRSEADICTAVDFACVLYFKQVLCLQRSAATALLLLRHGCEATMVIGVRSFPFRSHAWVEASGRIVNDKSYIRDIYSVLAPVE